MDFEDITTKAFAYAAERDLHLGRRLGSGREGSVWEVSDKRRIFSWAVKLHYEESPFLRERDCYRRLRDLRIHQVGGLNVPRLVASDDAWLVLEMTLVARPFLLDFASVRLDRDPDFTPEVMADWEDELRERFDDDYPRLERVLAELRLHGIFLTDVHPHNVAFR
jgi:hypothetical protein